ncbi:MAG: hypothetical protein ACYCVB_02220 [Bacilli bacterium]
MDERNDQSGAKETDFDSVNWSRRSFLIGTGGVLVATAAALFESTPIANAFSALGGLQVDSGMTKVYQQDYYFIPSQMTWRVGNPMVLHIHNLSPEHFHEMQIGRGGFDRDPNAFTDLRVQFKEDFWDGVHVTILEEHWVDNMATNRAIVKSLPKPGPWLLTGPGNGNFSPTLRPGGSISLQFTVPNKPGVWQYGCFVQGFIHYADGMRGTINILPA